jgi:Xaa-Pro aminopeptidase
MQHTAPGLTEGQLQSVIEYVFGLHGAREVAYGTIVANGNHACVLHYTENAGKLLDGDLVLVDAGGEYRGYASDITRTWPVNGTFSAAQRDIYQLVLDAQVAAIKVARPGVPLIAVHRTAARVMRAGLKKLGVLPATSTAASDRKIVKAKAAAKKALKGAPDKATYPLTLWDFFMHGTSHWMGLDVHDVGSNEAPSGSANNNRNKASKQRKLQPGMVFTVEPGLYLEKSDTRVAAKYRGIGIRIEDDVAITESGCEVLTRDVPKTIADIEALMASR